MFISIYTKTSLIPEHVYSHLEKMDICFKKELFQFETLSDVIIVATEHKEGDVVCACKVLIDYCSYKINKINYKKQLALIFCLETLRSSIIKENLEAFRSKRTEFRIYWNKDLFKDKIIEQFSKMIDLYPGKKEYYVLDYKNYLTTSGNDIDFNNNNNSEPFGQNGLFKDNPIYGNRPLGSSTFSCNPIGAIQTNINNKNDKIFGNPLNDNNLNDNKNDKIFGNPLNGINNINSVNDKIQFPKLNFGNINNEEKDVKNIKNIKNINDIKIEPPVLFNLGNNSVKKLNI